jgi:hypothetical protein
MPALLSPDNPPPRRLSPRAGPLSAAREPAQTRLKRDHDPLSADV